MTSNLPRFEAMNFGMILDATLRLYSRNVPLLIGISCVIYVPYYLFLILLLSASSRLSSSTGAQAILAQLIVILGAFVFFLFLTPLSTGAMTFAISQKYLGQPVRILQAFRFALGKFWTLLLSSVMVTAIVGLVMLACIIPMVGIGVGSAAAFGFALSAGAGFAAVLGVLVAMVPLVYIALGFAMVSPLIIVEGLNAADALRRSWRVTDGFRAKILGILIVFTLLILVLSLGSVATLLIFAGLQAVADPILTQLPEMIVTIVTAPIQSVAIILLYYDIRIRREGFDLEMLNQSLHGTLPLAESTV